MSSPPTARSAPATATLPRVRVISIAILAMGGEGGGVLADWIVDLAEHAGYRAQTTSVPGVSQRTGATIYYIELLPESAVRDAGRDPVMALVPVPGEVDIVIASELMEAGRAVQRGLVTPDRTTLIASTGRVYSMTERTAIGSGQVDSEKLLEACGASARRFVRADFGRLADTNNSVISAVLFGALAGTGALPLEREAFEEAIRRGGVGVSASLAAFAAGVTAATEQGAGAATPSPQVARKVGPRLRALADRVEGQFPKPAHEILLAAIERLTDYQDEAYASAYLDALEPVRDAESDPDAALLSETGRNLALWMTYEDAIRVADLKTRSTRFARVRRDARATGAQLVEINEFLHPGLQEIADIVPAPLGRWLLRTGWVGRVAARVTPRHGMIVQTSSLTGFLRLYVLAGLRRWRRRSLRFQDEHERIEKWLAEIVSLGRENQALALEAAELPRIVKGYGDTHLRGRQQFDAIMALLPSLRRNPEVVSILRNLREAALADETGQKFTSLLNAVK